ncbi:MAG: L-aspartate oxidase [Candidatus Marinimicrobia bacterium]|nr:L-aspartate oxidase [Candidatus Neomarinimicrobiota bacterium]MBL7023331.1 L-aspartate oxidase [Candidatus Neomarinimicrobiota bacterium]
MKTDILVIGSGLAGAVSAITAADEGKQVILITKMPDLMSGSTPYAQGGIVYKGLTDSPKKLEKDIIIAGAGHCWKPAVNLLCEQGPKLVEDVLLNRLNVDFDKTDEKYLDLTAEAAHSEPRIIHSKDQTGKTIQESIIKEIISHKNIKVLTKHTAIDLLTLSHHSKDCRDIYKKPACFGVMVLNNDTCDIFPIFASKTILATGGLGQIYLHTSNPKESRGDGIAMAWRAGARCFNLQYIQFHPTTLYHASGRFLISEALRGEGAKLIDSKENEFMKHIHRLGALAPRDVVARGIHQSMMDSNHPCVYLDISNKNTSWLKNRFPGIYQHCLDIGIDITKEKIPVVPSAHYSCGGVGVNLIGRTSLKRLYAVGEVSCTGVHGANRLASTSLLESLVWGVIAGKDAAIEKENDTYFPEIEPWKLEQKEIDPALITQDWLTIKNTMWNYVGLVRTRPRMLRAKTILRHLQTEFEQFYQKAKLTDDIIGLRNGIQTAIAVIDATIEARESRGTHYLKN